ncbi:MAG TPA: SMC-Scp complex subunit ScpB [Clostridia bacterium]|nr:SMC-Scp complex subunit ScpB [Clostridia bacterium]
MNGETPKRSAIEALLFAADGPVSSETLARLLKMKEEEVRAIVAELKSEYDAQKRGFSVEEIGGGFTILTRPEYSDVIEELLRPQPLPKLSQAALETLAVVFYKQPVSRGDIDSIRGVHSEGALLTLVERGLVTVVGRKDTVGRPFVYAVSKKCLEYFGIRGPEDLPALEISEEEKEKEKEKEKENVSGS